MPSKQVVVIPVPPGYTPEDFLKCVRGVLSPHKAGLVDLSILENRVSLTDELVAHIGVENAWGHIRQEVAQRMVSFLGGKQCVSWAARAVPENRSQEWIARMVLMSDPSQIKQV